MNMELKVLQCGSCEPLKAGVHATALGLAAVMGLYNAAAWLTRREKHLAVNAVMYAMLTAWESRHVAHHVAALQRLRTDAAPDLQPAAADAPSTVDGIAA
jgi:hypothetical protein